MQLTTELGSVQFTEEGGLLGLDGRGTTQKVVAQKPLGSIGRAACFAEEEEPFIPEECNHLGAGLLVDLLNSVLLGLLWGGLFIVEGILCEFTDVSEVDGLPGIEEVMIKTVFFAAPILTACNPAQAIKLQIADMFLDVTLVLQGGLELKLGLFASVEAEAELDMIFDTDAGANEVVLEGMITDQAFEIVSISPGWEDAKDEFEALIEEALLDSLLEGLVEDALTSFPLPSVDLSGLIPDVESSENLNLNLESLLRQGGYSVLYGELE